MRLLPMLALAACAGLSAQTATDDKKDALAVVQRTFDAMAAHDGEAFQSILLPSAQFYAVRSDGTVSTTAQAQFAAHIGEIQEPILERMWNPTVLTSGRMATVWAEYDFHRSGKFSHCGVDAVHLLKTREGWRIASIAYTVETTTCVPSPLGAPRP